MADRRTVLDPAREAAADVLLQVLGSGRSLTAALERVRSGLERPQDRALAQELAFGVMRGLPRQRLRLRVLLQQPLRARDRDVEVALLLGLQQLDGTRIPAHAAVHASVELVKRSGKRWAAGLVNAVLRRCQREGFERIDARAARLDSDAGDVLGYAHPAWLLAVLRKDWPEQWPSLCAANDARAPLVVRVNRRIGDRQSWLARLQAAGLAGSAHPLAADAVTLAAPCPVDALPGFAGGHVSVQDAAGQLVVDLLDLRPGQRVLDACAAPGSKTAHILEREPDLAELVAMDQDPERLQRLRQGLRRLGLGATCQQTDAGDRDAWWDGRPFDRILLDAPCSATGVIRRHPDIKTLRRPDDLPALVQAQRRLLESLWFSLRRGGILVYTTCSVLRRENAEQLEWFLSGHADARCLDSALPDGATNAASGPGWQVPTGWLDMDGFYYGVLRKD